MKQIGKAVLAGFIATIVLSAFMLAKASMGLMPDMNAIKMLTNMAHGMIGTPASPVVGWIIHFLIGTILWGVLFGLLAEILPGRHYAARGMVFSIGAWVLMMVLVMPLAGAGLFAAKLGLGAPIATLVLHLIYGAVLGGVYSYENRGAQQAAHARS
jgi:hypothetical protein